MMRGREILGRIVVLSLIVVVIVAAIGFAWTADDKGSAAVAVLSMLVAAGVGVMALPGNALHRLLGVPRHEGTDLRANLLAGAEADWQRLRNIPSSGPRISLSVIRGGRSRSGDDSSVPADDPLHLFEAAGGRLALAGRPGSGKTTFAIALFEKLLARARTDHESRIPVYLRLSAWRGNLSLEDWVRDQLQAARGLNRREAQQVLPMIVLLLDGLDEVGELYRYACAREIAGYVQANRGVELVVCCRIREWRNLTISESRSLVLYVLQPLSAENLRSHFAGVDEQHWRALTSALSGLDGEPLAEALGSPLMASLVQETWRDHDPAELVEATVERKLDEAQTRQQLWDYRLREVSTGLPREQLRGAIGLARAMQESGASEVRLDRLGTRITYAAWLVIKAAAVLAATGLSFELVLLPFVTNLMGVVQIVAGRQRRRVYALLVSLAGGSLLLLPSGLTLIWPGISAFGPYLAVASVAVVVGMGLYFRPPLEPPFQAGRRGRDAFATIRRSATVAVLAFCAAVAFDAVLRYLRTSDASPTPVALAIGFMYASLLGLDFAGQHVLARLWHRAVRGVRIKALLGKLVQVEWMQQTSDAHRFAHLELQRHLASLFDRTDPRFSFGNIGLEGLWDDAVDAGRRRDHTTSARMWQRIVRARPNNPAARRNHARQLTLSADDTAALAEVDRAIALNPADVEAWDLRAHVLRILGRYDDALSASDRALQINNEWPDHHVTRAQILLAMGRLDDALASADRAGELDPENPYAWDERASALWLLRRFDDALAASDRALRLDSDRSAFHATRAQILMDTKQLDDALESARRACELDPENFDAWNVRSRVLRRMGRFDDALTVSDRAAQFDRGWPDFHLSRVPLLLELKRLPEALASARRAREIDPDVVDAWTAQATVLTAMGELEEALASIDRAREIDPTDADLHGERAILLGDLDRPDEALEAVDRALELDDGHRHRLLRAYLLLQLNRPAEALVVADGVIAADADDVSAWDVRSLALTDLERFDDALEAADRALAIDPTDAALHERHATLLAELGRTVDALAAVDRALAIDAAGRYHALRAHLLLLSYRAADALAAADRAIAADAADNWAWNLRCAALTELGRYDEAVEASDRTLRIDTDWAGAHLTRGSLLLTTNHVTDALACADRATQLDSGLADAWDLRCVVLTVLERYDDALAASDRTLQLNPDEPAFHASRAYLLLEMDRHDEALASADRAVEQGPRQIFGWDARCAVYTALGRADDALAASDRAMEIDGDSAGHLVARAKALHAMGRLEDALATSVRACEQRPVSFEAWTVRGQVLYALGRPDDAMAALDRSIGLWPHGREARAVRAGFLRGTQAPAG